MAVGEFAVPSKPEDLLEGGSCGVSFEEIDTDDALRSLNGIVDCLCDSPTSVTEPENFNALFALIRAYGDIGDHIKSRVFDVLLSGLSCLAVHSDSLAASAPGSHPSSEFLEVRNAVRVHAFFLKWIALLAERAVTEAGPGVKIPGAKGAKGKGKGAASTKPKGRVVETWTWDTHRVKLLQGMRNLLLANLERVWSPLKPEEQFASLFVFTALSALKNAAVAKDRDARSAAVAILLRSAVVMGQRDAVVSGIVNLLRNNEHVPGPAVELVVAAAQQGERDFVSHTMREFGCLPMNELARDAAVARNFAAFLSELSEVMPALVLSHMSVVNPHLQLGESYVMRNAVLHAIGHTLIELSRMIQQERTETALKTREALLLVTALLATLLACHCLRHLLALFSCHCLHAIACGIFLRCLHAIACIAARFRVSGLGIACVAARPHVTAHCREASLVSLPSTRDVFSRDCRSHGTNVTNRNDRGRLCLCLCRCVCRLCASVSTTSTPSREVRSCKSGRPSAKAMPSPRRHSPQSSNSRPYASRTSLRRCSASPSKTLTLEMLGASSLL